MAFRQPTHAPQRTYIAPFSNQGTSHTQTQLQQQQPLADSQEWILFSPSAASTTNTYTTSTARTRTAGRSRISDFGSLDTAARSYGYDEAIEDDEEDDAEQEGEDGELDSLDENLHEFGYRIEGNRGEERSGEQSRTVLPMHDGLGSFRLNQTTMGDDVQEHLYAFERFNPRRVVKRRREREAIGEEEEERAVEVERVRRIEVWRLEQSRVLVDEIQRETRRRKASMSSERRHVVVDKELEDVATLSNVESAEDDAQQNQSFWNRITRRVIRDLMGIDDDLLAIIFGEALPEDDDLSTTPPAKSPMEAASNKALMNKYDHSSWEYKLLERISRELGILVNQISDHPGAFSTYLESQQKPIPYAGLPIIPETLNQPPIFDDIQPSVTLTTSAEPQFQPTLSTPLAIASSTLLSRDAATLRASNPLMSKEEWERDLDLKAVFRYLRSKFRSSSSSAFLPADFTNHSRTAHLATASTADTAARAARVTQHHPLVNGRSTEVGRSRRLSMERRTWKATVPIERIGLGGRRGSSSCASERMSANGWTKAKSGSSRHYWDFGPNSVGSGSLIASGAGGMGSWGEV